MNDIFWKNVIKAAGEEPYYFFDSAAVERRTSRMRKAISKLQLNNDNLIKLYLLAVQSVDALDNSEFCGASMLFWGGMSDDLFEYHCRWVVSLGFERYSLAINDPESFYVSFIDVHPHPVSPFFGGLYMPFRDEMYERSIDESKIKFTWPRGGGGAEIPDAKLRERFPEIARRLDQHESSCFDSSSDHANRTRVLIEQGKIV